MNERMNENEGDEGTYQQEEEGEEDEEEEEEKERDGNEDEEMKSRPGRGSVPFFATLHRNALQSRQTGIDRLLLSVENRLVLIRKTGLVESIPSRCLLTMRTYSRRPRNRLLFFASSLSFCPLLPF